MHSILKQAECSALNLIRRHRTSHHRKSPRGSVHRLFHSLKYSLGGARCKLACGEGSRILVHLRCLLVQSPPLAILRCIQNSKDGFVKSKVCRFRMSSETKKPNILLPTSVPKKHTLMQHPILFGKPPTRFLLECYSMRSFMGNSTWRSTKKLHLTCSSMAYHIG